MKFLLLIAFELLMICQMSFAHVVSSFYAEKLDAGIEILFDVGYAIPENRDDPNQQAPLLSWLQEQDETQHATLRKETEIYLRDCLALRDGDREIAWEMVFVDFQQSKPEFVRLLNGIAYYRVLIPIPQSRQDLTFYWKDVNQPDLVVRLAEDQYTTLTRGQTLVLERKADIVAQEQGESAWALAFRQGFLHVLPKGMDHMLFLAGMFFAVGMSRNLLMQSLCFTVAHTVTLGMCSAGVFVASPAWVEPIIAASIAFLALENILRKQAPKKLRLLMIFLFGLVHGCGFAQVLSSWIVGSSNFTFALVSANAGVEVAQIVVLLVLWGLTFPLSKMKYFPKIRLLANVAILAMGALWTVERIAASL